VKIAHTIVLYFLFSLCFGQTRAPQLSELIKRVDSLTNLIKMERAENQDRILDLKKQIKEKEEQVIHLEQQLGKGIVRTSNSSRDFVKTEKSVTIGKQVWMQTNLNVSFFRNGDVIPEAKSKEDWIAAGKLGKPAWCHYDNDPKNDEKYGKLYNWHAVIDPRGLAPVGWKIPEFEDLNLLDTYLWGDVGLKLKNDTGWNSWIVEERCKACMGWSEDQKKSKKCSSCINKGVKISKTNSGNGTNSSGFSALPGGFRNANGEFEKIGQQCNFWSSTPQYTLYGRYRSLSNTENELIMNYATKDLGMSVRCLKE
jgi:uncharacterized protein (TIGR02145 family)